VIVLSCLLLAPALAQAQASIAGTVRDSSGGVLPGVTVEASSPALIEKVRAVVTGGNGQYKIDLLRPGTYTVSFTLPGFSTVKREGIELTGTFTATINADMRVGALEETITVTGETPVVDVQNTKRQFVLGEEFIHELPSSRNTAYVAALLPGVYKENQDVGGLGGESGSTTGDVSVHGNADVRTNINGISVHATQGSGTNGEGNMAAFQEMQVDVSGVSAEQKEGGVRINLIPRDGSNEFSVNFYGAFANQSMRSSNLTQELIDEGLKAPNSLKIYKEFNPYGGGRIIRDKLWFFATARYNRAAQFSSIFYNLNAGDPNAWTYEPDTSREPGSNNNIWKSTNARLTWQATQKNKIGFSYDYASSCPCPRSLNATVSPEANATSYAPIKPGKMLFLDWTSPVTNRLLLDIRFMKRDSSSDRPQTNIYFTHDPGPGVLLSGVQEQSTGLTYRATTGVATASLNPVRQLKSTVNYITGAHDFKVGFNLGFQSQDQRARSIDSPMFFRFNNGVPNRLTLRATPWRTLIDEQDHGAFVQDRWSVGRLTVTGGLRYDYFAVSFPAQEVGPGLFVPNRNFSFPATDGVRWHDLEPRMGAVYDLRGDGKTALKVSLGKYLSFFGAPNTGGTTVQATFTSNMNPSALLVNSTNRSWRDGNRNFVPDCDLLDPAANGECGAMSNRDFGTSRPGSTYDPDTLTGWNKRPDSNWQFSAGVQRELLPRVSLDVSYFRTSFINPIVIDDRAVSAADFDTFSITTPIDPRLPGGGGTTITGLHNLTPAAFGRPADNYITFASNYGHVTNYWNGFDITMSARLQGGLTVQGGSSTGRRVTDRCELVAQLPEIDPIGLNPDHVHPFVGGHYCRVEQNFLTQMKFLGTYTVPKVDLLVAATYQSLPGPEILADFTATNAIVAPSLGRNLSGGASNVVVPIAPPGTMYGERMNQLDMRIAKVIRTGRVRTTAGFDIYNVFNANPVLMVNSAYASWEVPQSVLAPRFAEFVIRVEY
jgi:hypothetical protein